MNRPEESLVDPARATSVVQRARLLGTIAGYLVLVLVAWLTGSDALSALCVVVLVSAVLASGLRNASRAAWAIWILLVGGIVLLTWNGHGRTALDLVPLLVNLGLAILFGWTLTGTHTPLIARAIIAIEGAERIALPGVETYARALTAAWTLLFALQTIVFVVLIAWWLPQLAEGSRARDWTMTWLQFGGYLLPALFMLAEYAFRRWHLRHIPHTPPREFAEQLLRNWPQLLRDTDLRNGRTP